MKYKVAIVGATGYTGSELVRLLVHHPTIEIACITSESHAGKKFSDVHPFFEGICDVELVQASKVKELNPDLIFLALPHGISMQYVSLFESLSTPIIDFSGDFRLSSPVVYTKWYQKEHTFKQGFAHAAYGLPEINRKAIKTSRLIANPGCFPTGAILGLYPLIKERIIDTERIIVDAKTGVTGAGVKAKAVNHFSNVNDNFKAYGLKTHRHTIEIIEKLEHEAEASLKLQFTPHLLPVDRGILTTAYVQPKGPLTQNKIDELFEQAYGQEPFIRLRKALPEIKAVRGTNYCDVYATYDENTNNIIIITAIDNLVKGAAGAAVQNMNLLLNLPEETALTQIPLQP